ncbi:MAG: TolC family protein [Verrucomicrobia bacterium]|nr:TolC family protein [Verrucomicrobiota bacterium]
MTTDRIIALVMGIELLALAGCSTAHYRRSADKETAAIIAQKGARVPNMDPHFTIETNVPLSFADAPVNGNVAEFMGADAEAERGVPVISLKRALGIAIKHSRAYQNAKENVYLAALSLTLSRHQFTPIFSAGGDAEYGEIYNESSVTRQISAGGSIGANWLIRDIGKISAAFTTDFLRFLAGDPRSVVSSQLGATFTRPLLRNAGYKTEIEALTQAERNVLYDLRDFVLYRKNFSVQVATDYYRVLSNRDAIRNSYLNLQSSRKAAERGRSLAEEGRLRQSELGRLEQQLLTAENTWIAGVRTYKKALDDFKITLGVPVGTKLLLDDRELSELKILHPDINIEDSIPVALTARLDYQNVRDEYADTERKIQLAANKLLPQLDVLADASMSSGDRSRFALPDMRRYNWSAGASLDLPLDRKSERNSYRASLITRDRAMRALTLLGDQIALQVRESHRLLEQYKRTYEISEVAVRLAQRRVEEQEMRAELGSASAQDQVDAQNDLVNSKNQRTQALVNHTIARLQFWNNMGILFIKEDGQWQEVSETKR